MHSGTKKYKWMGWQTQLLNNCMLLILKLLTRSQVCNCSLYKRGSTVQKIQKVYHFESSYCPNSAKLHIDYLNYGNKLGPARVYMYMYVKLGRHLTWYCRNVGWARLSQKES